MHSSSPSSTRGARGAAAGLATAGNPGQLSAATQTLLHAMLAKSNLSRRAQADLLAQLQQSATGALPAPRRAAAAAAAVPPPPGPKVVYRMEQGAHRPGRRTKAEIARDAAAFAVEPFRPSPTRDRQKDIAALQAKMSGEVSTAGPALPASRAPAAAAETMKAEADPMAQLLGEIEERAEWLAAMEELGQAGQYRQQIQTEINLRVSQMERLAKEADRA
ncbi:hypothetical protein GGF32_003896 [Allomyces javanicus]|nr:hypothetical protein GGF32_003896 [Allomyces javanicus]